MYVAGAALISLLGCWLEQRPVGLFGQHGAMWLLLALCMPVVFAVADLLIHWRDGSQIRWRGGSR
jgi:hypothetical protein